MSGLLSVCESASWRTAGSSFHQKTRAYRVSQVPVASLSYHTVDLDPERAIVSHQSDTTHVAFQFWYTVDLFDFGNYEAQYLHLRYGLICPSSWLHLLCYLHKCNCQ